MSDADKLKKIIEDRVEKVDDALKKIDQLVEIVPSLQQQKDEDEFVIRFIESLPNDVVDEYAQKWMISERENDELITSSIPQLTDVPKFVFQLTSSSSSGTAEPYITSGSYLLSTYYSSSEQRPEWVNNVTVVLDEHSKLVEQRQYIPIRLNKLNHNLGDMFNVAMDSFNKCKNDIFPVDSCAIHMRDVIQQVWGGLTNLADAKNINPKINTRNLHLRTQGDRETVANILSSSIFTKTRLITVLDSLSDLHNKLSDTKFGKNPLNKNLPLLKTYYTQWLSDMDSISAIVI